MSAVPFYSAFLSAILASSITNGCRQDLQSSSSEDASIQSTAVHSKKITFIVGPISRSVSVEQIESFVNESGTYDHVTSLLKTGKINPTEVRAQLAKVYVLDLLQMDKILNSQIGIALLTRISEAIHPHSNKRASVQAIRSAIVLSLAGDNQLSPLEVLLNLPVDIDIDVKQLLELKNELGGVFGPAIL